MGYADIYICIRERTAGDVEISSKFEFPFTSVATSSAFVEFQLNGNKALGLVRAEGHFGSIHFCAYGLSD